MDVLIKGLVMINSKFTLFNFNSGFFLLLSFIANTSFAISDPSHIKPSTLPEKTTVNTTPSEKELNELRNKLTLLEEKSFMPTILPIVMRNKDALQLSKNQISHFVDWRKKNLKNIINMMTSVVEKHILFKKSALNPDISSKELINIQNEIFDLQRHVLMLKLECRDYLASSFNQEQWDNFSFLLSDNPKLASFLN